MNQKYDPKLHIKLVETLISFGLTNLQIAEKLNISYKTFYNWINSYPDFKESYDNAKTHYITEQCSLVEQKLLQKCKGYEYEESEIIKETDGEGALKNTKIKKSKKKASPDITSIKFWLTNKAPNDWSEKKDLTVEINDQTEQKNKLNKLFSDIEEESKEDKEDIEVKLEETGEEN